jgi:hypothetical protein
MENRPAMDSISSTVPPMAADRRVMQAVIVWLLSFVSIFVLVVAAILWVAIGHVDPSKNEFAGNVFVIAGAGWFATVMGLYLRYYVTFIRAALEVPDGASRAQVPRVVEAAGPLQGEQFTRTARVKTVLGRSMRCRIDVYTNGIRIWRGPHHAEPSFSFLYADILLAELATIVVSRGSVNYVRLVASQPRMAFLISLRRSSTELVRYLGAHDVPTFGVF